MIKKKIKKIPSSLPSIGSIVTYIGLSGDGQECTVVAHSNEFRYYYDNTLLVKFEDGKEKWVKLKQLKVN